MEHAASAFNLVLSIAFGVGAWLISGVIAAYFRGARVPKDLSRWMQELDFALHDLQGAEFQRAICYRRVADLIGQMPRDFDAVALTGMALSDEIGRAILEKAESMGLYPAGTFEKLGVVPRRHGTIIPPPPEVPSIEAEAREPTAQAPKPPSVPWVGAWSNGRLVPRTRSDDN